MNKIRHYFSDFYYMATFIGIVFTIWRLVRHWHSGLAEKTGHALGSTIIAAARKIEKTAIAIEEWADKGLVKNLGKDLDEVLTDTKKT